MTNFWVFGRHVDGDGTVQVKSKKDKTTLIWTLQRSITGIIQ